MKSEFSTHEPVRKEGHTVVEMFLLLRQEFPDIPAENWLAWEPGGRYRVGIALGNIINTAAEVRGTIDDEWSWERVTLTYPDVRHWDGDYRVPSFNWTGAIRVRGPEGKNFILVSFINAGGYLGYDYFVSTRDISTIKAFADAAVEATMEKS